MYASVALLLLASVTLSQAAMASLRGRAYMFLAQPNNAPGTPFTFVGTIDFEQDMLNLTVTGTVSQLPPAGPHGFHIHAVGDIGNGCNAATGHYNPLARTHGDRGTFYPTVRHVGDMANIQVDAAGTATIRESYRGLGLASPFSIIGRTVIIHAMPDDLGLGGNQGSLATGNAGARLACGIIGQL